MTILIYYSYDAFIQKDPTVAWKYNIVNWYMMFDISPKRIYEIVHLLPMDEHL